MAPASAVTVLESHRCVSCPFFWIRYRAARPLWPLPSTFSRSALVCRYIRTCDSFPTNGVSRHRRGSSYLRVTTPSAVSPRATRTVPCLSVLATVMPRPSARSIAAFAG